MTSSGVDGAQANGHQTPATDIDRPLKPGIYVPTLAFFEHPSEDLDVSAVAKHAVRLAKAGLAGITVQGSNGEAAHLSHEERDTITRTTRQALDEAGFQHLPIIVGCAAQSTRETIQLCREAKAAGGDYALILPPSYFKAAYTRETLIEYFQDVADASPIPFLIYNYPGAVSGIDLDSDALIHLAKHPKIVGCKLTCGNTGKLNRVAAATRSATPFDEGSGWMCMGGSADFTLQTLIGGGSGIITGLGNITPKACVRVYDLYKAGKVQEAQRIQAIVARGDWGVIAGGVSGTRSALQSHYGYGGYSRRPLPKPSKQEEQKHKEALQETVELENSL